METPEVKQIANLANFIQKKSSKRENPNQYRLYDIAGLSPTIGCMQGGGRQPLILLKMKNEVKINIAGKWSPSSASNGNVYDADGISPTIVSGAHGGCEPRIMEEKKADVWNTAIAEMIVSGRIPTDKVTMFDTRHRTVSENGLCLTCQTDKCAQQFANTSINTDSEGNARTINCHYPCMNMDSVTRKSGTGYGYVRTAVKTSFTSSIGTDFRIRKLTERECFRLMGVREDDTNKLIESGICKTQLYKLAGNSIVCDVMSGIFTNLFLTEDKNDELADLW